MKWWLINALKITIFIVIALSALYALVKIIPWNDEDATALGRETTIGSPKVEDESDSKFIDKGNNDDPINSKIFDRLMTLALFSPTLLFGFLSIIASKHGKLFKGMMAYGVTIRSFSINISSLILLWIWGTVTFLYFAFLEQASIIQLHTEFCGIGIYLTILGTLLLTLFLALILLWEAT